MSKAALLDHLRTGATHTCTCWAVTRRDGVVHGFTDHDRTLSFDGISFSPTAGLSARALASSSGLSVNNSAAVGVLSTVAITEPDIMAGRYDGAAVTTWLVRWDDVAARQVRFRGTIGEITRGAGGFEAELQGLTEALNQPQGRSYLKTCSAVLGDARCGVNLGDPSFVMTHKLDTAPQGHVIAMTDHGNYDAGWFEDGLCVVQSGNAAGLQVAIKSDVTDGDQRLITLWALFAHPLQAGDTLRFIAGCDKRADTCREKFANLINFQGFPDIPGDDWLVSVPRSDQPNTGGSLTR